MDAHGGPALLCRARNRDPLIVAEIGKHEVRLDSGSVQRRRARARRCCQLEQQSCAVFEAVKPPPIRAPLARSGQTPPPSVSKPLFSRGGRSRATQSYLLTVTIGSIAQQARIEVAVALPDEESSRSRLERFRGSISASSFVLEATILLEAEIVPLCAPSGTREAGAVRRVSGHTARLVEIPARCLSRRFRAHNLMSSV